MTGDKKYWWVNFDNTIQRVECTEIADNYWYVPFKWGHWQVDVCMGFLHETEYDAWMSLHNRCLNRANKSRADMVYGMRSAAKALGNAQRVSENTTNI